MGKYLKLLELCLRAKEKGHDCFLYYSPHIDGIKITVYKNNWEEGADFDKEFGFYINDYWKDNEVYGPAIADKAINYLENLIKESEEK